MKQKALWKDVFREIWRTRNKFMAIVAIVAIGTGFFAGVKVTCPNMKQTAQSYYSSNNLMDLQIKSTMGFTSDDLSSINQLSGVRSSEGAYSVDAFVDFDQSSLLLRAFSLSDEMLSSDTAINQLDLLSGRMPENSGECVIDRTSPLKIGDTITFYDNSEDSMLDDMLSEKTYTIVGTANSPMFVSFERGKSTLGNGTVKYFVYLPEENFSSEVYTDVYLTLDDTADLSFFSDEYQTVVDNQVTQVETLADTRTVIRLDEIKQEAQKELDKAEETLLDGQKTYEESKATFETEIADAKQQLTDGEAEYASQKQLFDEKIAKAQADLNKGQQDYDKAKATYDSEISQAEKQLRDSRALLESQQADYDSGLAAWETGVAEYEKNNTLYEEGKTQLDSAQASLTEGFSAIAKAQSLLFATSQTVTAYQSIVIPDTDPLPNEIITLSESLQSAFPDSVLSSLLISYIHTAPDNSQKQILGGQLSGIITAIEQPLVAQKQELDTQQQALDVEYQNLESARLQLLDAKKQLDDAKAKLNLFEEGKKQLLAGEKELQAQKSLGASQLAAAKKQIDDGKAVLQEQKSKGESELLKARQTLDDSTAELTSQESDSLQKLADAQKELADGRAELEDGKKELDELEKPDWYIWDRNNNPGYSGFVEDAERVDRIAAVFPVFFILVAALVCLTTMTRMVEEQRTQIGTLKAMGYGREEIARKYICYALFASVLGCLLGLSLGFKLFPTIIFNAYSALYIIPPIVTPFRLDYTAICLVASFACTGLTAFAACYKELVSTPSALMRPQAPPAGKRVLLERLPFIWKHLSFLKKVTVRNLFRYKKRITMTVIGIAGCTALMLTGFGLQHSIQSIVEKQYEQLFVYQASGILSDTASNQQLTEIDTLLTQNKDIEQYLFAEQKSVDVSSGKGKKNVYLTVPSSSESLSDYIVLRDRKSHSAIPLDDSGAVISEKIAKLLSVKVGDSIRIFLDDSDFSEVKISAITENYTFNFVYMTPTVYEETFGAKSEINSFFFNLNNPEKIGDVSEELLRNDHILTISDAAANGRAFRDVMASLNIVVLVLIISAGALAIVVLYNLASVNISERIREIATIKVLGFYDKEVSAYIHRESFISALIGMLVGLIIGIPFERFVISTAEIDVMMFSSEIPFYAFALAGVLTMLFAGIVNLIMHFTLKKVDMVESLKSVE